MLSYKEYKLLNESLYGAFNLGLRSHGTVGGIVSGSSVNGTEAALEAQAEEAIEEGKKAKKMKKKMDGDEEEVKDEEPIEKIKSSKEDDEDEEDSEEEDHEDEDDSEDDDDEDEEDSEEEDHEEDSEENSEKKDFAFMKKKSKSKMKKKSKKEWSEVMSDLESILESIDDEESLMEVKKGLEMMKKGMEKGMKKGCGCKKCGKYMTEDDAAWWKSVNSMLGANPDQKNWDGGWKEVGEVEQAVRESTELKKKVVNEVSSELLNRAAISAGKRHDPRGDRLKEKFANASTSRRMSEFESNRGIEVKVDNKGKAESWDVVVRGFRSVRTQKDGLAAALEATMELDVMARKSMDVGSSWGESDFEDSASMPMRMSLNIIKPFGPGSCRMSLEKIGGIYLPVESVSRKSAMMLSKVINDHMGRSSFIRPTDFPLE